MTSEEKLRALLAEAREVVQGVLRAANSTPYAQWSRDQHQAEIVRDAIDAALAEPVEPLHDCICTGPWVTGHRHTDICREFRAALRERDEARAEIERLRSLKPIGTYSLDWNHEQERMPVAAAAYQRGAEAMREAAASKAYTTLSLHDEPCRRSELRKAVVDAIEALPIPEDEP